MAAIKTYETHLFPNNTEGQGDQHSASWVNLDSATTEIIPDGSSADKHRVIRWEAGHHYSGRVTWGLFSCLPVTGAPGRFLNFHTQPNLPGSWWWGGGVSPLAFDYFGGSSVDDHDHVTVYSGIHAVLQASSDEGRPGPYHFTMADKATCDAAAAAGQWMDFVFKIVWGNMGMGIPGALTVWKDGSDTPVVNVANTNTHYFSSYFGDPGGSTNPGGGQRGVTVWQGGYNSSSGSMSGEQVWRHTAARLGVSLAEALADGVSIPMSEWSHSAQDTHSAGGTGNSFTQILASRDSAQFQVPASLGGTGPGGGGTADPTLPVVGHKFGKSSVGNVPPGAALTLDARRGSAYQAVETIDATEIYVLLTGAGLNTDVALIRGLIYSMSGPPSLGGVPVTKLAETASTSFNGDTVRQWVRMGLLATTRCVAGSWYAVEFHAGGVAAVTIEWDSSGGFFFFKSGDTYADGADVAHGVPTTTDVRTVSAFVGGTLVVVTGPTSPRVVGLARTTAIARTVAASGRVVGLGGGGL